MPIVSSEITHDDPQVDGRRYIHERHVDSLGVEYVFTYLGEADTDAQAVMLARVPGIELSSMTGEIANNVADISRNGRNAKPTLNYSLPIDNGFAVRAAYADMIQAEAVMTGDYFNTLTDKQLEEIFQLPPDTAPQVRTEFLEPAAALAEELRAETGPPRTPPGEVPTRKGRK